MKELTVAVALPGTTVAGFMTVLRVIYSSILTVSELTQVSLTSSPFLLVDLALVSPTWIIRPIRQCSQMPFKLLRPYE